MPVLKGEDFTREAPIFWEHEGNRGGRLGKWKIVSFNHKPWTLYDIENDRTEQLDLAKEHPEILKQLSTGWDAWAKRCHVEPWPEKRNSCGEPFKWAAEKYQIE